MFEPMSLKSPVLPIPGSPFWFVNTSSWRSSSIYFVSGTRLIIVPSCSYSVINNFLVFNTVSMKYSIFFYWDVWFFYYSRICSVSLSSRIFLFQKILFFYGKSMQVHDFESYVVAMWEINIFKTVSFLMSLWYFRILDQNGSTRDFFAVSTLEDTCVHIFNNILKCVRVRCYIMRKITIML